MAKPGPQKINRYGLEFKLRAVLMSEQPGVQVKDVAQSLCIHPFMLTTRPDASTACTWITRLARSTPTRTA
jgi:transposase-like protein